MMFRLAVALCLVAGPSAAQDAFRWVVDPAYQDAAPAQQGVVPLRDGGLWGLMGADGQWIAPPQYEAMGAAGAGRFAVQMGGMWGVVDLNGQTVLPFEYDAIGTPSDLTPVLSQGFWFAMTPDAVAQELPLAIDAFTANDGACVLGLYGGMPVAEFRAEPEGLAVLDGILSQPAEGFAVLETNGRFGHLDCAYGTVSGGEPAWDDARRFSEGLAAVRQGEGWGYVGPYGGGLEIGGTWRDAREFSEGIAPVQDEGGLWGYIDRQGQWVIPPQFDAAYSFSDGLAGVRIGDKRGFITPDGLFAATPQFDDFLRHGGGLVPVRVGDLWGVIAPLATDPASRLDLPLADLSQRLAGRAAPFALTPSSPHWYFAQDVVSLHSIHVTPDRRVMLTTLANAGEAEVALWDFTSRRLIRKLPVPEATQAVLLPGTQLLAVGTGTGHLALIDAVTGDELHRIHPHDGAVIDMVLSPDGQWLASTDGAELRIWSTASGDMILQSAEPGEKLRFSADGQAISIGSLRGGLVRMSLAGEVLARTEAGPPPEVPPMPGAAVADMALGPDAGAGGVLVNVRENRTEGADGFFSAAYQLEVASETTAPRRIDLPPGLTDVLTLDVSDDGRLVAYAGNNEADWSVLIEVRDLQTGASVFSQRLDPQDPGDGIARAFFAVDRLAFVPGGTSLILIGSEGEDIVILDPANGRLTGAFGEPLAEAQNQTAPPDGTDFFVSDGAGAVWVWDLAAGRLKARVPLIAVPGAEEMLWTDGGKMYLQSALDGGEIQTVEMQTLTPGVAMGDEAARATAGLADFQEPEPVPGLPGPGFGTPLAAGRLGIVSEPVGLHRAYDLATGALLAEFLATPDGEWLMLTPEGFFDASPNGARLVSVAQGLTAFSVDQVYQALYRPDLVRAKLAGDPEGEVARAAASLNIGLILETGPAPVPRFAFPPEGSTAPEPEIDIEIELQDEGGGIGRVEWRLNGLTVDVQPIGQARGAAPLGGDAPKSRSRIALDPGANVIEVVAYNAAGLLASAPRSLTVTWDGVATTEPPTLHVLAVGVNDYADGRLKLNYATADATAFADALQRAGAGLFGAVNVVTLLDAEVTEARLDAAFSDLGAQVKPQDVFLFFLAGHGKTLDGKYYFLPQDFRFDGDDPIRTHGIDQDRWQDWAARIKAKKSVMIYDTCESGSLTGTRGVDAAVAQSAAVARLTRAMGRTILSASTDDAPALEGYQGHGVLTWALLDAFGAADENGNATIEVTELAGFIDRRVPEISQAAFGLRQVPQMSIRGSDFALGAQVTVLGASPESYPATLTHVVAGGTVVLDAPGGAPVRSIDPGVFFGVFRIEEADGFARIAKDGTALGWVPAATLSPLQ